MRYPGIGFAMVHATADFEGIFFGLFPATDRRRRSRSIAMLNSRASEPRASEPVR